MSTTQLNTPLRLDHLAVWVADMEATTRFLTEVVGFEKHPMLVEVSADDPTVGGMEAVFIDGKGLWLEMILPTTPGPGQDILEQAGDGAIVEVNFEAVDEDYMNVINNMAAHGIQMLSMDGSPLVDGGRIEEGVRGYDDTHESGQRIAYWPTSVSCGTTVEVYEKLRGDKTNLLNIRNEEWGHDKRNHAAPRVDSVGILVEDIEQAAEFYATTLGLDRCTEDFAVHSAVGGDLKIAFVSASHTDNVWIQLIQPTSPGHAADLLKEKGSGYAMQICVEVDDLSAYCGRMQDKGITMTGLNGSPLEPGAGWNVAEPYGDRYCYFPLSQSRGIRIMMFERGPRATSMLHRRDGLS